MLFLLAAGCGFHAVGNGDGGDLDMGTSSMDDSEGADLFGVPPGSDLSMTSGGGCPDPLLLVGVENLHNGDTGGGRVARFSLTASGVKQCTTLSGQGLIAPQPLAVAAHARRHRRRHHRRALLRRSRDRHGQVVEARAASVGLAAAGCVPILNPQGVPIIAVAYGPAGSAPNTIREVDAFGANGAPADGSPWCIQGTGCTALPLSLGILSMSATPIRSDALHRARLFDAGRGDRGQPVGHAGGDEGDVHRHVQRAARVGVRRRAGSSGAGALRVARPDDGDGLDPVLDRHRQRAVGVGGPIKCASGCTTILHVVPDPTTPDGYFALCDGATVDTRTVVRFDGASLACNQILDGKTFGAESRLSRLGILQ